MPKVTGYVASPFMDAGAYQARLEFYLERQLFKAWDAWLNVFLSLVPIYTGESVGSILPLANVIGRSVSISPSQAAGASRAIRGGGNSTASLDIGAGKAYITYQTAIPHLIVNEYIDARIFGFHLKTPGPYGFQLQGAQAFQQVARTARLPNPYDDMDVTLLGLG